MKCVEVVIEVAVDDDVAVVTDVVTVVVVVAVRARGACASDIKSREITQGQFPCLVSSTTSTTNVVNVVSVVNVVGS